MKIQKTVLEILIIMFVFTPSEFLASPLRQNSTKIRSFSKKAVIEINFMEEMLI